VAVVGPTASGKSRLAMEVARRCDAEILSVDSMQVYRGMDIGTAKPTLADRAAVRHHMIDVTEPEVVYSVADFHHEARKVLAETAAEVVLIVGGSGLHFRAVVDPMAFRPWDPKVRQDVSSTPLEQLIDELVAADPEAASHVDMKNPRRVGRAVEALRLTSVTPSERAASSDARRYRDYVGDLDFVGFGIERTDISGSVGDRLCSMRSAGLLEEVRRLAPRLGPTAREAVGYRQLLNVVTGAIDEDAGFEAVRRATMQLVKRQRTFFRRDPRLRWLNGDDAGTVEVIMSAVLP
jgi:tRNA dimethylallyltransferase